LTKCVLEREDSDIVILIDIFGSFSKSIATVANLNNIPTLYIQHFTTSTHPGYETIIASKAALPGSYDKNIYIQLGTQPDKLVITGQSKYDLIPKKIKKFNRKKLYNELGLDSEKGIFVLTTQPFPHEENQKLLYAVLNAMKKYPDKQLVIKMHPREVNKSFYQKIVNEMHVENVTITKNIDIIELLIGCEIMMTRSSNTALEAIILNKPVIIINLLNEPDFLSLVKKNAAVEVCKSEDLPIMIKEVLSNKKFRNKLNLHGKMLINHYFYKIDGRSSERIVNLIKRMINR
jgi:UDP-N-acetylglucosamine 2-epimerase